MNSKRILFKFPSRSRPERLLSSLRSIIEMTHDKHLFHVFLCLDSDDPSRPLYELILTQLTNLSSVLTINYGVSHSKIHAINRVIPAEISYDIIINWSDDMKATVYGFDIMIKKKFYDAFPEGDGFLHMSDQDAKEACPVLYIADKKYFERDGYIYFPGYKSLWCDNESKAVAILRERYSFCPDIVYNHLQPAYGHLPADELWHEQQSYWNQDEALFKEREKNNFYL